MKKDSTMNVSLKGFSRWADKVQIEASTWCDVVDWADVAFPWAEKFIAHEPIEETARALMRAARDEINRNIETEIDAAAERAKEAASP